MTKEDLIKLGFIEKSHKILGVCLDFELGRNRRLSFVNFRTPNEILYICEYDEKEYTVNTDLIVISNYDYDGYITYQDLCCILYGITKNPKFKL